MVIGLAVLTIVVVVAGVVLLVSQDVMRRPTEWHSVLKDWQPLFGSVLGLLGAAGVFILGIEIQAEQSRRDAFETQRAIGKGLAIETERLSRALLGGQVMATSMRWDGTEEDKARLCRLYMDEVNRYLAADTPVYDAVLGQMQDFGDQNLQFFVRFHGVYDDILRALASGRENGCSGATAEPDVGYVASLINGALMYYDAIVQRYDVTALAGIESLEAAPPPASGGAPAASSDEQTAPAAAETATANTSN